MSGRDGNHNDRNKRNGQGGQDKYDGRGKQGRRSDNAERGNRTGRRGQNGQRGRDGNSGAHKGGGIDQPRKVALKVLAEVGENEAYANLLLPKLLKTHNLKGRDAAFATELTYGTLRAEGLLDAVIGAASSRPLTDIAGPVLDVLRLGTYQLLRTRVDSYAAVDTSVRAVAKVAGSGARGFVNAILRKVSAKSEAQWVAEVAPDPAKDPIGYVALKHAHPRWIAEAFALSLGSEASQLQEALAADDARPTVHLVARPGELTAEELALITGGEEGPWSPYAVRLESGAPGELEPVRQGLAAVQDEGSQLIARAVVTAQVQGEDSGRWLDLCSGPGGKTAFIGGIASIEGAHVDAVELSEKRAGLVEKATSGLPVTVTVADGRSSGLEPGFDRVLVDVPCSGLGSLRRRPEARWRKSANDIAGLTKLQLELLTEAVRLTRPGGIIVYSTCSPHLRETRGVVDKAVGKLDVTELDAHALVQPMSDVGAFKSVQMWPHRHGTDAMFFAVLRKNG